MKNNNSSNPSAHSRNEIVNVNSEIKNIVLLENSITNPKSFTSADLWNIQRQYKTRAGRRFM